MFSLTMNYVEPEWIDSDCCLVEVTNPVIKFVCVGAGKHLKHAMRCALRPTVGNHTDVEELLTLGVSESPPTHRKTRDLFENRRDPRRLVEKNSCRKPRSWDRRTGTVRRRLIRTKLWKMSWFEFWSSRLQRAEHLMKTQQLTPSQR